MMEDETYVKEDFRQLPPNAKIFFFLFNSFFIILNSMNKFFLFNNYTNKKVIAI